MTRQLLLLDVCCPSCKAVLTEGQKVHLDGYVKDTNQEGAIYLSAVFGDYSVECDLKIPDTAIVQLRCPVCEQSLMLQVPCKLCGAPMASLNIVKGGSVEFCSRRGCKAHALGGFGDVDQMMALVNSMFNTPHD